MNVISKATKLLKKLRNKEYRDGYVSAHVRTWVAHQIRSLRNQNGLSQADLAQRLSSKQSVVSRMEDPAYGKMTIQSLLDIGSNLDVALWIQFISYPEFIRRTRDVSTARMEVPSYVDSSPSISDVVFERMAAFELEQSTSDAHRSIRVSSNASNGRETLYSMGNINTNDNDMSIRYAG